MSCPLLAVRGSTGLEILAAQGNFNSHNVVYNDASPNCRCMAFSNDGELFGWCNSEKVKIVDTNSWRHVLNVSNQRASEIVFSPLNNFVVFWEPFFTTPSNPNGSSNLQIYRLSDQALVKDYIQKNKDSWQPQWSNDEFLCSRLVTNEVHFFEDGQLVGAPAKRLVQQNATSFSLAPCSSPYKIAVFVKGSKGAPSFVRLFVYPKLETTAALANRSFFRADAAQLHWNNQGTALLVLSTSDVDKTGGSYYGEQSLHFMSSSGEGNLVPFARKGPVYSLHWHPNSTTFAVVQGYMPSRAVIYNLKCEPVFDFGTGPRNLCQFNAHGNILCLAGFANLTGIIEMWNVKEKKLVSKCQALDTTEFQWSPNGFQIMVATTAPRLRVGNCYKVLHYTGNILLEHQAEPNTEIWQVCWQSAPKGKYPEPAVASMLVQDTSKAKVEAYRPPSARAAGTKSTLKLHTEEGPQNLKQTELGGAALKNKKKREARAKAKQESSAASTPVQTTTASGGADGTTDRDRRLKAVRKKLRQIEDLKEKKRQGKPLEVNQLEKLKMEQELWKEMKALELNEA